MVTKNKQKSKGSVRQKNNKGAKKETKELKLI